MGRTPQDERNAAQTVTLWAKKISLPRDKTWNPYETIRVQQKSSFLYNFIQGINDVLGLASRFPIDVSHEQVYDSIVSNSSTTLLRLVNSKIMISYRFIILFSPIMSRHVVKL